MQSKPLVSLVKIRAHHKARYKAQQEGKDQGVIFQMPGPQGAMALVNGNVS